MKKMAGLIVIFVCFAALAVGALLAKKPFNSGSTFSTGLEVFFLKVALGTATSVVGMTAVDCDNPHPKGSAFTGSARWGRVGPRHDDRKYCSQEIVEPRYTIGLFPLAGICVFGILCGAWLIVFANDKRRTRNATRPRHHHRGRPGSA